jgi:bifunctional UDP-N-acetylglucosamine pyrophosphorylase/glucosamine-1-phosphate N-acetyltransferase
MTQIVILAAGKGTRTGQDIPKVLVPLNGKPMIQYLMEQVKEAAVDPQPIVIVSPENKEIIKQALSNYKAEYAIQDQQLGTGHAVSCAQPKIKPETKKIIVLYGDHPFLTANSIKKFAALEPEAVTVMPTILPDFSGWHHNFYGWGRFVRNEKGEIKAIIEAKDASEVEKQITEVNPGFMCFNKDWLFANINKLKNENKAKEFYLTDMVGIAFKEGYKVGSVTIEPREAMGINSPDELKIAENLINS